MNIKELTEILELAQKSDLTLVVNCHDAEDGRDFTVSCIRANYSMELDTYDEAGNYTEILSVVNSLATLSKYI